MNKPEFNTQLEVDLEEVEKFVTSDKFTNFLLSNTTDFAVAGYVLQTLLDSLDKYKSMEVIKNGD